MAELVSKTYSEALFDVAVEENCIDKISSELEFIVETFKAHPEFFELFRTPQINVEERKNIVLEVFGDNISQEVQNFIKILLDKGRGSAFLSIKEAFDKLVSDYRGEVAAVVESAVALSEDQLSSLAEKLSQATGKKIVLENNVNPDILGGLIVKVGDKVVDGSVKMKLNEMKDNLAQIIV